jgi:hypothetical protein
MSFGELHSLKWRFEANGDCRVVCFDMTGTEFSFTGATMEEAFRAAQTGLEAAFGPSYVLCFSGAVAAIDDNS